MKILLLGGDTRFIYACKYLNSKGKEAHVINSLSDKNATISEYYDAINQSEAIVLPSPLTSDNIHVKGTLSQNGEIRISEIDKLKDNKLILTPNDSFGNINYSDETLFCKNAYLTAEGTLGHLLCEYRRALRDARITILGYGRISVHLLNLLRHFTNNITVVLRDQAKTMNLIKNEVKTSNFQNLKEVIKTTDILINTVPVLVVNEEILSCADKGIYIVDLASNPGGVDYNLAKAKNIDCIHLLGIPGKCAPETAGEILGESILKNLITRNSE